MNHLRLLCKSPHKPWPVLWATLAVLSPPAMEFYLGSTLFEYALIIGVAIQGLLDLQPEA